MIANGFIAAFPFVLLLAFDFISEVHCPGVGRGRLSLESRSL